MRYPLPPQSPDPMDPAWIYLIPPDGLYVPPPDPSQTGDSVIPDEAEIAAIVLALLGALIVLASMALASPQL